jgi:hypothetical protein
VALGGVALGAAGSSLAAASPPAVIALDGEWLLATDPANEGVARRWFDLPVPGAVPSRVPWILQDAFPGYHGLAWYWRDVEVPRHPHPAGRFLLRFLAVDYKADVWVNGQSVGSHEGGESPFVLDVTGVVQPGAANRIAVRVLNPTHEPIDGIVLRETAHRNKALPYSAGNAWDQGGIIDSVELLVAPAVRLEDIFVRPDWRSGALRLDIGIGNTLAENAPVRLEIGVGPATSGGTVASAVLEREVGPGSTRVETTLSLSHPRLWELNDPTLYRVTVRVRQNGTEAVDEQSVRCGFRDFRLENGYFRLNGRRLFLRCSHTGNCCPVGLELPLDPDWLRRDLLNVKVMGFNMIRFIAGVPKRYQLDLCDEIGLLVYEESYAGWCMDVSPKLAERYNESVFGMVRRDRNHPSVAIWGLLNETHDGPVFRHAVSVLPALRVLDDSRLVLLNSGQWERNSQAGLRGLQAWHGPGQTDPCVTHNPTATPLSGFGITWAPGQLALHPGAKGEYCVVRWTCPETGRYGLEVTFRSIAEKATTDVHVLQRGVALHDGFINLNGAGAASTFVGQAQVTQGEAVDIVVGFGNGHYGGDTTAAAIRIEAASGTVFDAAAQFSLASNPNGPWSYGRLAPGAAPDPKTLALFEVGKSIGDGSVVGAVSNPGANEWQDLLCDQHPYQHVPHTAGTVAFLRTVSGGHCPLFISEYGVGSAVDLWRATRHYERLGKAEAEDARLYRGWLERFLADWERWRLSECFAGPDEFFIESQRRMARERLFGLNAIRANPNVIGHSLTGTVDQGMTGEGLFTTFRELKPGTTDALFDALAPLRLCLFASPSNLRCGERVRLEAVLANEDALRPGDYPVRLQLIGPRLNRVLDRVVTVTVAAAVPGAEPPFAVPFFAEEVAVAGPPGQYRFLATMERGGAPLGGAAAVTVDDPSTLPSVSAEIVLWGEDAELAGWLGRQGIRARPFGAGPQVAREVILVSAKPPPGGAAAWGDLVTHLARGSVAVFLAAEVFRQGDQPTAWLPLRNKGTVAALRSWLYHKDEWAKNHAAFAGLPCGGMLDYAVYREILPDLAFSGQDAPAEAIAGGNDCSCDYGSGLFLAAYDVGAGRFIVNTLLIRERLGVNPVADRLLRNLLNHAASRTAPPLAELPPGFAQQLQELGYR